MRPSRSRPPRSDRRGRAPSPTAREELARIAGLPAVAALFATRPDAVERLFFLPALEAATTPFCRHLAARRKPYRRVEADELARVAGTVLHGGIVALAPPRPVLALDARAARAWATSLPMLLVLDGVANPHNFGAIARTAAFFGLDRIVLSDHPGQAGASDAAIRVAEGGLERLSLYRASDLPATLRILGETFHTVATVAEGGGPVEALAHAMPVALVLGNEEAGLPRETIAASASRVTIRGTGLVQSLNVAAAAAVLIHAVAAGRAPAAAAPRRGARPRRLRQSAALARPP
ncbi:MAG: RNA methyltransferase, partial [Alphaproteobacteria bacterium]|nr:RNA methyltransferase [Alphaproteobacteria bacterium]